jgi:hypothetical protein
MVLNNLVDPIIIAMYRHAARLQLLAQTNRPGISEIFREESAHVAVSAVAESYFVNVGEKQIEIPVPADAVMAKGLNAQFDFILDAANSTNARRLIYFVDPELGSVLQRGGSPGAPKLLYIVSCTPALERTDLRSSDFAEFRDSIAQKMLDLTNMLGPAISTYSAKMNEYWQQKTGKDPKLDVSKPEPLGIFNKDAWSITMGLLTKAQFQDPKTNAMTQKVACEISSVICARNRLLSLSCRSIFQGPETIGSALNLVLAWRDKVLEMNPNTP